MSDISRKEHINRLKTMQDCIKHYVDPNCDNCEINYMRGNLGEIKETLAYAIASLEADEAYQLMEEQPKADKPTVIDWNNCHTPEQLEGISTTKNDLVVEKTDMIDKSNFSQEQYKTDLQSAYDSGYE